LDRELVETFVVFVAHSIVLAAIPFIPILLVTRIINGLQDARVKWTPYSELAALAIGFLAGVLVIGFNFDRTILTAAEIFRDGGPWDLTFQQFLAIRANPFSYSLERLLPWPFSRGMPTGPALALFVIGGAVAYAPVLMFRSPRGVANGVRNFVIILWGAYATVYFFCFGLWLLNKLNFWAFLLLLLLIQAGRSKSERIVLRLK
jgi:hypothetical protein